MAATTQVRLLVRTFSFMDAKNRDAKNRDAKNRDAKNRSRKREGEKRERERERGREGRARSAAPAGEDAHNDAVVPLEGGGVVILFYFEGIVLPKSNLSLILAFSCHFEAYLKTSEQARLHD